MRVPADTHTAPRRTFPSSCASNDYPKATLQPRTPQTHSAALSKTAAPENRPPATHAALTPARPPAGTHRQCQPKRSHCAPLAALRAGCSGPQERAAPRAAAAAAGTDPHAVPAAAQRCAHSSRSHLGALFATASLEAQLLKRQLPACPELSLKARPRRKARRCGRGAARGPSVARQARTFPRGFHEPRSSTEAAVPPGSPCPALPRRLPPPAGTRFAPRRRPTRAPRAAPGRRRRPPLPSRSAFPGGPQGHAAASRRRHGAPPGLPPPRLRAPGSAQAPAPRPGGAEPPRRRERGCPGAAPHLDELDGERRLAHAAAAHHHQPVLLLPRAVPAARGHGGAGGSRARQRRQVRRLPARRLPCPPSAARSAPSGLRPRCSRSAPSAQRG